MLHGQAGFVVQMSLDAARTAGRYRGRVQHLRTCDAAHFESLEELAMFMRVTPTRRPTPRVSRDRRRFFLTARIPARIRVEPTLLFGAYSLDRPTLANAMV